MSVSEDTLFGPSITFPQVFMDGEGGETEV